MSLTTRENPPDAGRDRFLPETPLAIPPFEATPEAPSSPDAGSPTPPQFSREPEPLPEPAELLLSQLGGESRADRRRFRILIVVAAIAHLALFFVVFPEVTRETQYVGKPGKVYVLQQARFKPPPPKAERQEQQVPKKKAKKIPIPDPTPDDPEPIEVAPVEVPDLPETTLDDVVFGIPDGPDPGTGVDFGATFQGDALQVGDGVAKPIAIHKPQPRYTEEARQARIQGVVILSCVVTEEGDVANLKVIKGLPLGLDKSALETISTWKFKPARDLQGNPVPVYFNITASFWLQ
ncbi:MAG: energy transducer TonB [Acidobacteriota bacterium]